jgi:sulfatase maturation enzyme AslB (radical SAM superfamily)
MAQFRIIEFQLLQACNARCIYCAYEQNYPHFHEFFPLHHIDTTLSAERPEWVWFEGGEVSLSDKTMSYLLEAMQFGNRYGVKNRINTNAQNLDPAWAKRLADGGLKFACVSFDSIDVECYGKLRGFDPKDSRRKLDDLIRNIEGLCDAGVIVDVEATVTRFNVGEFQQLYDFVESLASPKRNVMMGVQCLVATQDKIFDLYPSMPVLHEALTALIERAKHGKVPIRICCSPLVPCSYPELYAPHPNVIWVNCSCGHDYVHIHANGDVLLCGFWDHGKPIGNLNNASLHDIWHSSALRREAMQTMPQECRGCEQWEGENRCHNTCFSIADRLTGSFASHAYTVTKQAIKKAHAEKCRAA